MDDIVDWVPGDQSGLDIPAHGQALRSGGENYLTDAFRASGVLGADNRVTQITRFEECFGGGTGRKFFLSVDYEKAEPGLQGDLFVKFSRDFDNQRRDSSRHLMDSEVRFAVLSQAPDFPIAVAKCYFADFHRKSGTGLLITQCVAYGSEGIEPHYAKCLDYEMPAPLEHYKAVVRTMARLAGTHKAGRLAGEVDRQFPFDVDSLIAADHIGFTAEQLQRRVARLADFAAQYGRLLPESIVSPAFFARLAEEAPRFLEHEMAIRRFLFGANDFIALCHWNANVDNAWFRRDEHGEIVCGLLDWARVGQMNVAQALYGALSGAEPEIWDHHLGELLALFAAEFRACGGPVLDVRELELHLDFTVATMGLAYIMDSPAIIRRQLPDLDEAESRFDVRFRTDEDARVWLHMMTMFLNQWQSRNFGAVLERFLDRTEVKAPA